MTWLFLTHISKDQISTLRNLVHCQEASQSPPNNKEEKELGQVFPHFCSYLEIVLDIPYLRLF